MQNPSKKQGGGERQHAGASKHHRFEPLDRVRIGGVDHGCVRPTTGRWLVCVAIDVATRCILGMRMAPPTATARLSRSTLLMTVSDETLIARAAGAVTPWDMALDPVVVATDAGGSITGVEFVPAAADLGAARNVRMRSMPHLRGTIERLFGTIDSGLLP